MRRGAKPAKAKVGAKPPITRKPRQGNGSRVRDLEKRLAEALKREAEGLEQQTATAEILRVISQSPTDVQPVFDTILESATRLCAAENGILFQYADGALHTVACRGLSAEAEAAFRGQPARPGPHSGLGRMLAERRPVQVEDVTDDVAYRLGDPLRMRTATLLGARTAMWLPLLRNDVVIGALAIYRREVRPFTDKQIELIRTFADQAVIAIENARLFNETKEALERQTATSEILRVISSSPTEVGPTFDAIVSSGKRLSGARECSLLGFDGEGLTFLASTASAGEEVVQRRALPYRPHRGGLGGRVVLDRAVTHIPDVMLDREYTFQDTAAGANYRAMVGVPLLSGTAVIGVLMALRAEPGPFSDVQIGLLETFADQAVIAIENVRLFTELQEKNRELALAHGQVTDALEKQTATGEILKTIAQAQTNAQPVFETIVQSAARLCKAAGAGVFLTDGETLYHPANHGVSPEALVAARARYPRPLDTTTTAGMAILTRSVVQVPDVEEPSVSEHARQIGGVLGIRSFVSVPMLREGEAVGAINVIRRETGLFSDAEVELLQTFADQAVIAIENVRLFKELEARNRDLTEALEQQTATSEILGVISASPTNEQPVFDTIVNRAGGLCNAETAVLYRFDGEVADFAAHYNLDTAALQAYCNSFPCLLVETDHLKRVMDGSVLNIEDIDNDPHTSDKSRGDYRSRGARSTIIVPMLREGRAIGAISVTHRDLAAFSDKRVQLLKTFADQAVIAVENVRLFKELEARTGELTQSVEQLTALGEVSRAVSSTLDVETVLDTIVSRATQLAGADSCAISEYDDATEVFHVRATHGIDAALVGTLRSMPLRKGEGLMGRAAETREPIQVADIAVPGAYESQVRDVLIRAGFRAVLSVPLLRDQQIIGSLSLLRKAPGEFSPEVIEVLKSFATQSALAIQNARLFREIADKSAQLEAASRHKSEFLANMSHELRTPLNAIIGFSEILAEKMFGDINEKQTEYLQDILESGRHLLSLINDILDLSKIEAGRMELELAEFDLSSAIGNALILVRERASRRGIRLGSTIDERLGMIGGDERKVKQVLLNLLSNALKFTPEGGRIDVAARLDGEMAEVSVTDTGIGIAPEDQGAVFEEFRQVGTADKKAEGTGLGLALSRKFIELHGGRIWVTSQVGSGSTFTFTLPLRG